MLHLIYGDDREALRQAATALRSSGDFAETFSFTSDTWNVEHIVELAEARPLFGGTLYIEIHDALTSKDGRAALLSITPELAASVNTFVFVEPKALKETLDACKEAGASIRAYAAKATVTAPEFNSFALTDAFAGRDKKLAWVLYQKALRAGKSPEELGGLLFWQLKNLLLVKGGGTAAALGMKPFVFSKASALAKKWEMNELANLSAKLVAATHEPRRGLVDAESTLEKILLSDL